MLFYCLTHQFHHTCNLEYRRHAAVWIIGFLNGDMALNTDIQYFQFGKKVVQKLNIHHQTPSSSPVTNQNSVLTHINITYTHIIIAKL